MTRRTVDLFTTSDEWPGIRPYIIQVRSSTVFTRRGEAAPDCTSIVVQDHERHEDYRVVHLSREDARRLATALLECVMEVQS